MDSQPITKQEIMKRLKISERTFFRLLKQGKIKLITKPQPPKYQCNP